MEIKKICVLGAGLMGNGIVQVCAQAGYSVAMRDIEQRFIDNGMNMIKKNLDNDVKKGRKTPDEVATILSRITPTIDLKQAAGNADVVVEVIIEIMDVKKRKKDFAKARKRCTLVSLDRIRSSSLNLLLSEYAKVNFFGSNDSKYFLAGSNRLNSTTESLILAQDERWRRA